VAEPGRPGGPGEPGGETPDAEESRWGRLYGLVLGMLALEIAGLWVLELVFR
jgi:hypothetical protein